jgi:hypothetical protein
VTGSLFLAAPPGTTWPLSLDQVEAQLHGRFPEITTTRETFGTTGEPYISFRVPVDGDTRHGLYAARGNLVLNDGDPAVWADTIAWFIDLLPPGTPMAAMVENEPVPTLVPAGTTSTDDVRRLYESLDV